MKKLTTLLALLLSLLFLISGCGTTPATPELPEGESEPAPWFDGENEDKPDIWFEGDGDTPSAEEESSSEESTESSEPTDPDEPVASPEAPQENKPSSNSQKPSSQSSAAASKPSSSSGSSGSSGGSSSAHVHSYKTTVTKATCKNRGYTTYRCACGSVYYDNFVNRLDCSYGEWKVTVQPTYTKEGEKVKTCSGCGSTIKGDVPRLVNVSAEINDVIALVNEERAAAGLSPLTVRSDLANFAAERAVEIEDYFSHDRPVGEKSLSDLIYESESYRTAGENIARGQRDAANVMESWMNSAGHRENILRRSYKYIGVGCYVSEEYGICWVQVFAG